MRERGRYLAIGLALRMVLAYPAASAIPLAITEQNGSALGAIIVDAQESGSQLLSASADIRVHSLANQVNLAVVVERLTEARFNDLPSGEYVIRVAATGFQPAQTNITLAAGQMARVFVEVTPGSPPSVALRLNGAPTPESSDPFGASKTFLTAGKFHCRKSGYNFLLSPGSHAARKQAPGGIRRKC